MLDHELMRQIKKLKQEKGYTLYDLSKLLDIQVGTIERWLQTGHINKVYAQFVKDKLKID